MKKIVFVLIFILGIKVCLAQKPVEQYDGTTKKYGIIDASSKVKKWLTLPTYKEIKVVTEDTPDSYQTVAFIAGDGKKETLIGKDGKTKLVVGSDDIERVASTPRLFVVLNNGGKRFYHIDKGLLTNAGIFSTYEILVYRKVYTVKINNKKFIYNYNTNELSKEGFNEIDLNTFSGVDSLFIVKDKKWGVYDVTGKITVPCEFDTIIPDDYIVVKRNNKFGIIELNGKYLLECKYDQLSMKLLKWDEKYFNSNNFPVKLNGKWGIVNAQGEWSVPNIYDTIYRSMEGGNLLVNKDGKMGIINGKTEVFPFKYTYIEEIDLNFRDKMKQKKYLVSNAKLKDAYPENGKWGLSDSSKFILEANADYIPIKTNYKYKIDTNSSRYSDYEDSTLVGYIWNIGGVKKQELKRIDSTEAEIVDATGQYVEVVKIGRRVEVTVIQGGKTGVVDRNGTVIIPIIYEDLSLNFVSPYNEVYVDAGSAISNGKAIPEGNDFTYYINNNQPIGAKLNGKWGAIDWRGKTIVPFEFDSIFHDRTRCMLDATDSVYNSRNYPRKYFRVYKNGLFGHYTFDGKFLCEPLTQTEIAKINFTPIDSLGKKVGEWENSQFKFGSIVANNVSVKQYTYWRNELQYDYMGNEMYSPVKFEFDYIDKAKFNIQNTGLVKYVSNKWADDILLIDDKQRKFKVSELRSQLKLNRVTGFDSLIETVTNKKVDIEVRGGEYDPSIIDHYFFKYDGLWYLYNLANTLPVNQGAGFDSIQLVDNHNYRAFVKNKHAYYGFSHSGPFNIESEVQFPDTGSAFRMAVRNCTYSNREYNLIDTIISWNENFEQKKFPNKTVFKIPLVSKGEFNLIDQYNKAVFTEWPSAIIIPPDSAGHSFSLTDENSFTYNKDYVTAGGNWQNMLKQSKRSVAVCYDSEWRLTTTQNPDVYIDGFKSISIEGDKWKCVKKEKSISYTIDGLKKVKVNK